MKNLINSKNNTKLWFNLFPKVLPIFGHGIKFTTNEKKEKEMHKALFKAEVAFEMAKGDRSITEIASEYSSSAGESMEDGILKKRCILCLKMRRTQQHFRMRCSPIFGQ